MGTGVRYGLGLAMVTQGGVIFVGHHGGVPGFEAENEMLPGARYAIVVLSDTFDFATPVTNRAVIAQTLPELFAQTAARPATAAPEDAAVTAKLRALLTDLQHGTVDRTSLSEPMNKALTPDVVARIAAQFGPLGALRSLTFRDKAGQAGFQVYHYSAAFAGGQAVGLTITLDGAGKIAGFFGG